MDEKEKLLRKKLEEDKKKKELMKVLYEQEHEKEIIKEKRRKPIFTNIFLSLLFVCSFVFSIFLIIDSSNRINETYEIINAILILLITINLIISFPKTFFKKKTGTTIITCLLIIGAMTFNVLYLFNIIKLPKQNYIKDYTNKSLSQALTWTEKNNINHEETFEYSDNVKKYNIINQNIKAKTLTKNIKNVQFSVSNGPDYNKTLILPDMIDKDVNEVLKFIDDNFLNNVDIIFEENNEIENGKIIKQNVTGNIKRNDKILFTASLGDKSKLKKIKLKNLKNKKLLYSKVYLEKNGIEYEIKYEFSNKIERGKVIKTNKKVNEEITQTDKIILTISKGKEIKIPNLKNKKLSEITKWIIQNNLQIEYEEKYDSSIKKGNLISINYKKGEIIEETTLIKAVFSKGKLKLPKFETKDNFKQWADKYKIKYEIKEEFNNEIPKNNIIKYSIKENQTINPDETIIVYISKGKSIKTPDLIGMTKDEANKTCNNLNLKCSFYNTLSTKKEGTIISQSIEKDTEIEEGTNIEIEVATKKQNEVTKKKKESNNTNNNQNNNQNNNEQNNCKNYELNLGAGSTGEQTKQIIIGQNPNLKFSWNPVNSCPNGDTDPGTICSSSHQDGSTVSNCETIKITYVK